MEKDIVLSVIIPTKNRYSTLLPILESLCNNIVEPNIEFVIQDNSEDNLEYLNFQKRYNDSRIRYEYINNDKFSIKENTERAIERVYGKYAIFIGDDDLISPNIMHFVKEMESSNIECLIYPPAYYWWNTVDFVSSTYYHRKKAFWYYETNTDIIEKKSDKEIAFLLNNGASSLYSLPRFYHGIVKTEILNKIKARTGSYLNGSSPDMAFSVSIALEIDSYSFVKYPISVFGASKNSGGGWSASKKHYGRIEEQRHLPHNILELWDSKIPKIWSEYTIYAQTTSEILRIYNDKRTINYDALYATMIALDFNLRGFAKDYITFNINFFKYLSRRLLGRVKRKIQYKMKKFGYNVLLLDNVEQVMKYLKDNI